MIRSITYAAERPGPKLLILGAIHGDEKCGTAAIKRVIDDIDNKKLFIASGQVTFVPVANPRAYELDRRYTERNLNRYLVPMEKPDSYEAELGNILCPMLAACDVLLDIHSYTVGGPAFASVEKNSDKEKAFAAVLGAHALIGGWDEAYAATGRGSNSKESVGTTGYARQYGALAALIECGQHRDPEAPEIAYRAIRNALTYLDMVDEVKIPPPPVPPLITITHVYYRDELEVSRMAKKWKNLEPVTVGEAMAVDAKGLPIIAPDNGFVVMPKEDCPVGEEWFYFGVSGS